jgi:hypothetical protein
MRTLTTTLTTTFIPSSEFNLPYHPAYGLDNRTRVEVLRSVIHWKLTVKQAARIHKLSQSTVYRWVADVKKPNTQGTN